MPIEKKLQGHLKLIFNNLRQTKDAFQFLNSQALQ